MMKQEYDKYSTEDHAVWQALFSRQIQNLEGKSCPAYLKCLGDLKEVFRPDQVPDFNRVGELLYAHQGWQIEVVKGLIPVREFWNLLAQKRFCSSTWLRSMEQLDYLEEPDMFHDSFGHMPLLIDPVYSEFAQRLGEIGLRYSADEEKTVQLQRLYWFTIEFGLLGDISDSKIYGAGILSSYGESNHIYSPEVEILPFDLEKVMFTDFVNSEIQTRYYIIPSLHRLNTILTEVESLLDT